jgi:acetyltransferase-like isoleucine patch superfamily enzyme
LVIDPNTEILVITLKSYTAETAIREGLLVVAESARIADGVKFIPFEDDGESAGIIQIGLASCIREGAIICSGVQIGANTIIGHNSVIRRCVILGNATIISHMVCVERGTRIGDRCRISSLTHLTGECVIEDDVQVGARVVTINDNNLRWRRNPTLRGVIFRKGCRVGSGVTVLGGIEIGAGAMVGAGAVVTKNVDPNTLVYGVPAFVHNEVPPTTES